MSLKIKCHTVPFLKAFNSGFEIYRDSHIFSDTLDKSFMVNWFTWPCSLLNTKFTLILYPHILKILLRLSNYGSRYSLADNQRSSSEITHPHCLAFMREMIDASSVLSLNNLIKINTWILSWCRNQTKKIISGDNAT